MSFQLLPSNVSRTVSTTVLLGLLISAAPIASANETTPASKPVATVQIDAAQCKALLNAAREGNLEALEAALAAGAPLDFADKNQQTALMVAAQAGKTEIVRALLEKGANANLQDENGRTALHLATQIGAPKKKKFNLGKIAKVAGNVLPMLPGGALLGAMGSMGSMSGQMANLGALGQMAGSLGSLLGGKNADGSASSGFDLSNKTGWTTIIGTALQGDAKLGGSLNLESLLSSDIKTLRTTDWINLMSGVKGANPEAIAAISNLAGGDEATKELWADFVSMASSADRRGVSRALSNASLAPMLKQATSALATATGELPGNAGRHIVNALLAKGANANLPDEKQQTAAQLAQARGWTQIATLLGAPQAASAPTEQEQ